MLKPLRYAAIFMLLFPVMLVGAQPESCGLQYVVERGDSLFTIAQTCDVTIDEIREFNPDVTSLIQPGDILFLPDPAFEPTLTIAPTTANGVLRVEASVDNFPPNTLVRIGVGLPGEVALSAASPTTDANGSASAALTVPGSVGQDAQLFVTAASVDNSLQVTSDAFTPAEVAAAQTVVITPGGAGGGTGDSTSITLTTLDASRLAPAPAPYDVSFAGALFDRANIYLIAAGDAGETGIAAGCGDSVVPVQVPISPTVAPLTASIDALLENTAAELDLPDFENPMAGTGLEVDQILIINGEAQISLTGENPTLGTCELAQLQAQLDATALQFSTVDRATVTVEGEPLG